MKKLLIALLFPISAFAFDVPVRYVYDGDTIMITLPLPQPLDKASVRLLGIDTPELAGKCLSEKAKAKEAKLKMIELIGKSKIINLQNFKYDKYGARIDANVKIGNIDLSEEMIRVGLARKYDGGKKSDWCN